MDETPIWATPIRAMLAELDTVEDDRQALDDLDVMLLLASSMSELNAFAVRHANAVCIAAPHSPRSRAWCAFCRELAVVDATAALVIEAEVLLEDAPGGYDGE